MNKKINKISKTIISILTIVLILTIVGCAPIEQTNSKTKSTTQLQQDTGVQGVVVGPAHFIEAKQTEVIQQKLMKSNPIPDIAKSLERENLGKRLNLLNDQNKIFYVYLVSYGKVMAYYTAQGKVSSVNSKLTTQEQIVKDEECIRELYHESEGACYKVVESPDLDGSYGTNGDGIFFFTTEGAYVEWAGEYMVSDYPLKLSTPPALVREIE